MLVESKPFSCSLPASSCRQTHIPRYLFILDLDLLVTLSESVLQNQVVGLDNHYNERDIDRYHWNTAKFKTLWRTKFAVLIARERGRIGSDAALDVPQRLQAHSYDEMNEGPAR
eukprot:COSAG05_NODE_2552_length_2912_cov_3.527551_4_plen_114_part_00